MRWEEKDYILRLIQEFGRFLRALRDAVNDDVRLALMDAQCRKSCGMSLRAADALTAEALAETLSGEARLSMALLLAARAETVGYPDGERMAWQRRALRLLASCREEACPALAEVADALLRGSLDTLTAEELLACAAFLRACGRIDLMDNAVFFLWETLPDRAAWRGRLTALYEGLGDEALSACGMSAADVTDSLSALMNDA